MTAKEIRKEFLKFFESKHHKVIPRASLVPQEDPTTLFTGSGMQPMIPYLLGEEYAGGHKRLVDSQPVFRAVDVEEIGDSEHLTNFEMLGNWSLGDYFKKEQIPWMAEFLFDCIKLDPQKVYVTCYIGNEKLGIPRDDEAIELWKTEYQKRGIEAKVVELGAAENGDKLGMQGGRIFLYDGQENWWSRGGDEAGTPIGDPCGPDSEMFYDFGEQYHDEKQWGKAHPASDSPRFFEIGNNVFMGYQKKSDSQFVKLKAPNIDQGAGLERLAAASLNDPDVYKTDLLWPIIEKLEKITGKSYDQEKKAHQVVADHIKSAYWLAVDGVVPSNTGQGYVLRRLIRRALRFGHELGINSELVKQIAPVVKDIYGADYPEMEANYQTVLDVLNREERIFRQTLRKGLKTLEKMVEQNKSSSGEYVVSGDKILFPMYDTYGFPTELTLEEAYVRGWSVEKNWQEKFDRKMAEQRQRSKTATKGTFKGGLGGSTEQHKKYHTATHLMYQALRDVLGDHVIQRGSNITEERLRFDFSHPAKVTPEELAEVENIVNNQINQDLVVTWKEYPTDVAVNQKKALGQFGDRYGETVKVYSMQAEDADKPFSFEICGGPHVDNTKSLHQDGKKFKIVKEESSSAGIRRIKAKLL